MKKEQYTLGERISDKMAEVAGSWTFIIGFIVFLILWVAINCKAIFSDIFDPFPFILLNLFLSCLAAIQAPILLMSQNRQSSKDRARLEHDIMLDEKADKKLSHLLYRCDIIESNLIELNKKLDDFE